MSTVDNVSFTLTIETGNQAVVNNVEMVVAHMLVMVATQIRDGGRREGIIRDDNGQRVGTYCLSTVEGGDDDDNG